MIKRLLLLGLVFASVLSVLPHSGASALGLKVAPLNYDTTLKEGEKKQGFVDVSNPSTQTVAVKVSVQAFKQINDDGGLQFYDGEKTVQGIQPEQTSLELGSREAIRLFFEIDGNALPQGDVFAAIFFTTDPKQPKNGVGQLVRVGTLLSIVNKTPGERSAQVTGLQLPFVQISSTVKGSYTIKNTGRAGSGFYPTVDASSWPASKPKQIKSSLIFGGRERSNDFSYDIGFGIHNVQIKYGDSQKSQWVITVAPWMLVLALLVTLVVGVELLLLKKRRKSSKKNHSKLHPSTPER